MYNGYIFRKNKERNQINRYKGLEKRKKNKKEEEIGKRDKHKKKINRKQKT